MLAQDDFFKRKADLSTRQTAIEGRVAHAVAAMRAAQSERVLAAEGELSLLPEWPEFTSEEQAGTLAEIQALVGRGHARHFRPQETGRAAVRY